MTRPSSLSRFSRCRGFTLVELAIALVVAGFIIGAVWVAAANVWGNYRIYRANQQIAKLTQNIREYYMNAQVVPAGNITLALDGLSLFPFEMRRNQNAVPGTSPIDHPFNATWPNGALQIQGIGCLGAAARTCFRVQMFGMNQDTCIKLLTYVPIDNAELGIVQVQVPAAGFSVQSPTTMITATQAQAACNQAGATNEVDWDFKLHN